MKSAVESWRFGVRKVESLEWSAVRSGLGVGGEEGGGLDVDM